MLLVLVVQLVADAVALVKVDGTAAARRDPAGGRAVDAAGRGRVDRHVLQRGSVGVHVERSVAERREDAHVTHGPEVGRRRRKIEVAAVVEVGVGVDVGLIARSHAEHGLVLELIRRDGRCWRRANGEVLAVWSQTVGHGTSVASEALSLLLLSVELRGLKLLQLLCLLRSELAAVVAEAVQCGAEVNVAAAEEVVAGEVAARAAGRVVVGESSEVASSYGSGTLSGAESLAVALVTLRVVAIGGGEVGEVRKMSGTDGMVDSLTGSVEVGSSAHASVASSPAVSILPVAKVPSSEKPSRWAAATGTPRLADDLSVSHLVLGTPDRLRPLEFEELVRRRSGESRHLVHRLGAAVSSVAVAKRLLLLLARSSGVTLVVLKG